MIHLNLNLFYEVYDKIDQDYQKWIPFFPLILLDFFAASVKENPKISSIISSVSLSIIIYMLSLFVWIVQVLSESLEKIKLIATVNWIFHSPWVLWS